MKRLKNPLSSREDLDDIPYMEPKNAPLLQRFFAFFLDSVLIGLLSIFITTKLLLPHQYPDDYKKFSDTISKYVQQVHEATEEKKDTPPFPTLSEDVQNMIIYANKAVLIMFWLYFSISSFALGGGSLGKKIFGLTVVDAWTYQPISVLQTIFRSGFKAFALFYFFPVLLIVNFTMVYFNRLRFAGHDYFSRTRVVVGSDALYQIQETSRKKEASGEGEPEPEEDEF